LAEDFDDYLTGQIDGGYEFPCLDESNGEEKTGSGQGKNATASHQADVLADIEKQSFERSYGDSFDATIAERSEAVARARTVVGKQQAAWKNMQQAMERKVSRAVVGGALELATIMIGRALEADPGLVRKVVSRALEMVVAKSDIVIRSNPEDWQVVKEMVENRESEPGNHGKVRVESDSSIGRGGCIIETEFGIIDARISSQLDVIRRALEV